MIDAWLRPGGHVTDGQVRGLKTYIIGTRSSTTVWMHGGRGLGSIDLIDAKYARGSS